MYVFGATPVNAYPTTDRHDPAASGKRRPTLYL
jgi:hypothetical protein